MNVRYDTEREVYRDCRWCGGRGCNQCKAEADKEYKQQFPNGPQPIATFTMEDIKAGKLNGLLTQASFESADAEAKIRAGKLIDSLAVSGMGTKEELMEAMVPGIAQEILTDRIVEAGRKS